MTEHKFSLTQEDIDQGIKSACRRCPMALAFQRTFNNQNIGVTPGHVSVYEEKDKYFYKILLPGAFTAFVNNFDAGRPVKPIECILELKEPTRCISGQLTIKSNG